MANAELSADNKKPTVLSPTRQNDSTAPSANDQLSDILRQVKKIEIRTNRLVSSLAAGPYRSAFRGQGMAFEETREYSPGDDVRQIDWNVTARAGTPYVKVFREERELNLILLVDTSGSMRFGAIPGISPRAKLALAAEAAAVIAITALKNNDRIGLVTFSDRTELHLPARKGRGHVGRLLREVLAAPATTRPTDLGHALDELVRVSKRRSVCFLISDFLFTAGGTDLRFNDALARASRRHDVVGLRVCDPAESTLPSTGAPIVVQNPEGRDMMVFSGNRHAQKSYAQAYTQARADVLKAFHGANSDLVELRTDQSAFSALSRFFRERRRRIRG
jgi:uncharacterized protein (DUF58 family)